MKTHEKQELLAQALRKNLSAAEKVRWEECLREDPGLRENFAEESALQNALESLPDAPLSSNFTARVLGAALREAREQAPWWKLKWTWIRLAPGVAVALLLAAGLVGYRNHVVKNAEMVAKVRSFSEVAAAMAASETPPEEVFQNFEAIQRLSFPVDGDLDLELLVALQK
jgi:anti-sigma factor RsiW